MALCVERMLNAAPWLTRPVTFSQQYLELISRRPIGDTEEDLVCLRTKESKQLIWLTIAYDDQDDEMVITSGWSSIPYDFSPAVGLWLVTQRPRWDKDPYSLSEIDEE